MEKASKELLKEFVNSQHFTSTTDIMNSMKELFSGVLQQVMEAEPEDEKSECVPENLEEGSPKNDRFWLHPIVTKYILFSHVKLYHNFSQNQNNKKHR